MLERFDKKYVILASILVLVLAIFGIVYMVTSPSRNKQEEITKAKRYETTNKYRATTEDVSDKVTEVTTTEITTEETTISTEVPTETVTVTTSVTSGTTVAKTVITTTPPTTVPNKDNYINANRNYGVFYVKDDLYFYPEAGTILRTKTITSSTTRPKGVVCSKYDNGYHCRVTNLNTDYGVTFEYGTNENDLKTFEVKKAK